MHRFNSLQLDTDISVLSAVRAKKFYVRFKNTSFKTSGIFLKKKIYFGNILKINQKNSYKH